MEKKVESLLLALRWLLLPLYVMLVVTLGAIYVMVARESVDLWHAAFASGDTEVIIIVLVILDLVLIGNLLLMVAISSYESFISKINVPDGKDRPEWLGKLDSGNVKVKVLLSIVMISAIHLLRAFMTETSTERLLVLAGVHLVFVISTLLLSFTGRKSGHA